MSNNISIEQNKGTPRTIYCHFSFKRPKGLGYGLFAVAFYHDFNGKQLIGHMTKRQNLWEDQQFVTAIQSYAFALQCIYEAQGKMRQIGIGNVLLVTDNSTLAGWIANPKKNKQYTDHMNTAVNPYRIGSPKEIVIGVGLCEARNSEKSYKYCKPELAVNELKAPKAEATNKLDIGTSFKSAIDILQNDEAIPVIVGMDLATIR